MVIVPYHAKKISILSQRFGANSSERMDFFCAGHMPSLTYLSIIRKYYSTSSTSSYVCTRRHVGNSRKRHDIDGPKMEQERQMSPNVGPTFFDMSPTCRPSRQCCVKIADANIRQTQLRSASVCGELCVVDVGAGCGIMCGESDKGLTVLKFDCVCVYTRSPVVRVFATTGYQPTGQCSPPT
jgi:hypothetical protein